MHASSFGKNSEVLGCFSCNPLIEQRVLLRFGSLQGKASLRWERACPGFARAEKGDGANGTDAVTSVQCPIRWPPWG